MHLFSRFLSSFMEQEVSEYMVFEEPMWKLHRKDVLWSNGILIFYRTEMLK